MTVWITLATVWTVGVPFYLRFLVAVCGELRRLKTCRLVRIQPAPSEVPVIELKQKKTLHARAA